MKIQIRFIFYFIITIFLSSCYTDMITPQMEQVLNKNRKLDSPRYLVQTHYVTWINSVADLNTIIYTNDPDVEAGYLPPLNDYLKNPTSWQQWRNRKNTQYRILGLLPTGTEYHFYKIDVPDRVDAYFVFYAVIDSGSFKDTPAYYRYSRTQDAGLLRTLTSP
jgi:hypothetical protein